MTSIRDIALDANDYRTIPRANEFRGDLKQANRDLAPDSLLLDIIGQLDNYHRRSGGDAGERLEMLVELFQSCNSWIARAHQSSVQISDIDKIVDEKKTLGGRAKHGFFRIFNVGKPKFEQVATKPGQAAGKPVDRKQFQVVLSLFAILEKKLADTIGNHDRLALKDDLVRLIGRDVNNQSKGHDAKVNALKAESNAERMADRIFIEAGKMYRYAIDVPGKLSQMQLLNSGDFADNVPRRIPGTYNPVTKTSEFEPAIPGFAPFVMSLDRIFYMREHTTEGRGLYHSYYLGGGHAGCAGTMRVENGVLTGIRVDSGHYQPTPTQMANCLRALQSLGILIDDVEVVSWDKSQTRSSPDSLSRVQPVADKNQFGKVNPLRAPNTAMMKAVAEAEAAKAKAAVSARGGAPAPAARQSTASMDEEAYKAKMAAHAAELNAISGRRFVNSN